MLPTIELRPYQRAACDAVHNDFNAGLRRVLLTLATGGGKTLCGATIAKERGGRLLFLVHTDELADQAIGALELLYERSQVGLVKAAHDQTEKQVVVASIQTLARPARLERLLTIATHRGAFRTVIADEAHRSPAPTWMRVLTELGLFTVETGTEANQAGTETGKGGSKLLGLTATPGRLDRVGLDTVFQHESYTASILDGITADPPWLVDLYAKQVAAFDLRGVKTVAGDFTDTSLADAITAQHGPQTIVKACQEYAVGRKKLVFLPSVEIADATTFEMQAEGIAAATVTGGTPRQERKELIHAFRVGEIEALNGVNVFTEGFDAPCADCIVIGRPTQSQTLFTQMVGRGSRLFPGKKNCLVLDLVGAADRHKLVTLATLAGKALKDGQSLKDASGSAEPDEDTKQTRMIDSAEKTGDVGLFSTFNWQALPDGSYGLVLPRNEAIYLVPQADPQGDEEKALVYRTEGGRRDATKPLFDRALRIDYAQGMVETLARKEGWFNAVKANAPWKQRAATAYQRSQLRQRLDPNWNKPSLTSGEAQDLLDGLHLQTTIQIPGRRTTPW